MKAYRAWLIAMIWTAAWALRASADEAPVAAPAVPPPVLARQAVPASADRLDLDVTAIRGNQELPRVLYIVPWKEPGLAEPAGRLLNSLVDEALAPVDREVFRRQVGYFDQLYPARGKAAGGGGASP